jgi:hypothetical protein
VLCSRSLALMITGDLARSLDRAAAGGENPPRAGLRRDG